MRKEIKKHIKFIEELAVDLEDYALANEPFLKNLDIKERSDGFTWHESGDLRIKYAIDSLKHAKACLEKVYEVHPPDKEK